MLALDEDGPTRRKFLARLQGEISKRGTIDVLRHGIKHGAHDLGLFYGTPSAGNPQAQERFEQNRFTVVRQLRYSRDETQRALDIGLFINGLPVFTFELKNSLTKQTAADAVEQYRRDRNPREKLFELGRCVAHFAVDESEAQFCTAPARGRRPGSCRSTGAGTTGPATRPTRAGSRATTCGARCWPARASPTSWRTTPRWWRRRRGGRAGRGGRRSGRATTSSTWCAGCSTTPAAHGAGHGATSSSTRRAAARATPLPGWPTSSSGSRRTVLTVFDSIIVVTDRVILDRQIRDTIRQYAQVGATVGHAEQLRRPASKFIKDGQEGHHLDGPEVPLHPRRDRQRATHAAFRHHHRRGPLQPGRPYVGVPCRPRSGTAGEEGEDETFEDRINRVMESRKLLPNASYFAFTRHPEEQDAGDLRRARPAARRRCPAPRLPQLHDEAGHPGSASSWTCWPTTRRWPQLLPARQDSGGRPRVRRQERRRRSCGASSRATTTRSA